MRRPFRHARIAAALLGVFVLAATPFASAASAHKASRPHVSITPSHGLLEFLAGDGVYVDVHWSGFPSHQPIYMHECTRGATDPATQCSQGGAYGPCGPLIPSCPGVPYLGESDKTGSGEGVGQVAIGLINSTQSGDPIPGVSITCDYQDPCSLWAGTNPNDLATGLFTPITFATPPSGCPDTGDTPLHGSTGSAAFRMLLGWATTVCKPPEDIAMQTTIQTSSDGIDGYIAGEDDYAATSLPMTGPERAALARSGRGAAFAPISGSGLVFAFRVVDTRTGNQITHLVLTPDMLAAIFTGKAQTWAGIKGLAKLNPGVHFPALVGVIARGDGNEDTLTLTKWIWAQARATWEAGGVGSGIKPNPFAVGPTEILPSLGQAYLVTGANKEASSIRTGDNTDLASPSVYGLIGYVESSYAAQFSLPTVSIRYPNGQTVSATPKTIEAGIAQMQPDCVTGLLQPNVHIESSKVWPMPTVSYLMVPHGSATAKTKPAHGTIPAIQGLLHYATVDGEKHLPAGYVPLPKDLKQQTSDAENSVVHAPKAQKNAAPICPPPPSDQGSGTPTPPPPTGGGTGTGETTTGTSTGGTTTTPSEGVSPSPAPTTTPTTVIVAAKTPPMALTASKAGLILPSLVMLGLIAAIVGLFLLYGDRLFAKLAPVTVSVKKAVPTRAKRNGSKGTGSG